MERIFSMRSPGAQKRHSTLAEMWSLVCLLNLQPHLQTVWHTPVSISRILPSLPRWKEPLMSGCVDAVAAAAELSPSVDQMGLVLLWL